MNTTPTDRSLTVLISIVAIVATCMVTLLWLLSSWRADMEDQLASMEDQLASYVERDLPARMEYAVRTEIRRELAAAGAQSAAGASSDSSPIAAGEPATNIARVVEFGGQRFDIYEINLRTTDLSFHFSSGSDEAPPIRSIQHAADALEKQGRTMTFATNGGIFDPAYRPVGLYIEDGREIAPLNRDDGDGNFFLKPNGVFAVTNARTARIADAAVFEVDDAIRYATQSGPLLVSEGRIHPGFSETSMNKRLRSGVGVIGDRRVVFAISHGVVTFHAFATLFREFLACDDALYLDGTISKMYLPYIDRHDRDGDFSIIIATSIAD